MARHTATIPEGRPRETSYRGEVTRRRIVRGFALTELRYRAVAKRARTNTVSRYFALLTQGGYAEHDVGRPFRLSARHHAVSSWRLSPPR